MRRDSAANESRPGRKQEALANGLSDITKRLCDRVRIEVIRLEELPTGVIWTNTCGQTLELMDVTYWRQLPKPPQRT